jgi:ferredoxin-NADP reductase
MPDGLIRARLTAIYYAARDTNLYEFRRLDDQPWPAASAGAHIDLHLPNGMMRQYSLVHAQGAAQAYVVGVRLDRASRGGSSFLHEKLRVGAEIDIGGPRNNFRWEEAAPHSVLIAGGIGITPIMCMIERLEALGKSWTLHYSCRSRAEAAFIAQLADERVTFNFDEENGGKFLDLAAIAAQAPRDAHLYCCGPAPMLQAFEGATASFPREQVHVEYFTAIEAPATEGAFIVELRRSQREIAVPEGRTILEALREAGIEVSTSCEEGVCGACETRVISGTPDHRDMILTNTERAASKTMMICCSGSKSERLVLDL